MSQSESCGGVNGSGEDNAGGEKGKMVAEDLDYSSDGEVTDQDGEPAEFDTTTTRRSTLDCLASLEASLPMKRGLSSHYDGRSKTFGNLSELSLGNAIDLAKREHAVNKRRRLLLAHEYHDKTLHAGSSSSSSTMTHTSSMPLFPALHHHSEDEEDEEEVKKKKGSNISENQEDDHGE
ncbi:hypothetical protein Salat_0732000 [Sesamum alatum]|uniref:Uncharacterized protein n=1 Tax=Sesamum alatum TaxID=300844 RepID=A0AAE1YSJ6_9LAMI|nr:hypothetical protein Salat_0732000 [Sesamum alatum]